jgi:PIN domain nuclease of toxin-antitoxin system
MQYLVDTHVFLWFISDSKELSQTAKTLIEDGRNEIYLSIASLWEISIKTAL